MKEQNTIGILNGYSHDELCTIGELREHISTGGTVFKPHQYCDWRYNTDLRRFSFDPYTGEKIDWKEVEKLISMNNAKN